MYYCPEAYVLVAPLLLMLAALSCGETWFRSCKGKSFSSSEYLVVSCRLETPAKLGVEKAS